VGNSSFTIHSEGYNVTDGNQLSFDADVTLAMMDTEKGSSSPLPDLLREKLNSVTWAQN
jgi:acyl-CoA thioesterase FadM